MGFRSDPGYVASLHAHPERARADSASRWGALLRASEALAMDRMLVTGPAASAVGAIAERADPAHYGGVYITHQSGGGRINVAFTRSATRELAARMTAAARGTPVAFVRARYSMRELANARARAIRYVGRAIVSVDVSERENRVVLGVEKPNASALRSLRRLVASDAIALAHDGGATPTTRATAYPPAKGGLLMNALKSNAALCGPIDPGCTSGTQELDTGGVQSIVCGSGFTAIRSEEQALSHYLDNFYLLTAGHCAVAGTNPWSVAATVVGNATEHSWYDGMDFDGAIIDFPDANRGTATSGVTRGACTYVTDTDCNPITSWQTSGFHSGDVICDSFSNENAVACGQITSADFSGDYSVPGSMRYYHFLKTDVVPIGGDSGSPAYAGSLAKGLVSGSAKDHSYGVVTSFKYLAGVFPTLRIASANDL
jgi:hypothetical protein